MPLAHPDFISSPSNNAVHQNDIDWIYVWSLSNYYKSFNTMKYGIIMEAYTSFLLDHPSTLTLGEMYIPFEKVQC